MSDTIKHYGSVNVSELIRWTSGTFSITTESGREETRQGILSHTGLFGIWRHPMEHEGRKRIAYMVVHIPTGIRLGGYWEEWKAKGFANIQECAHQFWARDNIFTDTHKYCAEITNAKLDAIQRQGCGFGGTAVAALLEDYYTKRMVAQKKVHLSDLLTHETLITDERQLAQYCYDALFLAPGGDRGGMIALQDKNTETKH